MLPGHPGIGRQDEPEGLRPGAVGGQAIPRGDDGRPGPVHELLHEPPMEIGKVVHIGPAVAVEDGARAVRPLVKPEQAPIRPVLPAAVHGSRRQGPLLRQSFPLPDKGVKGRLRELGLQTEIERRHMVHKTGPHIPSVIKRRRGAPTPMFHCFNYISYTPSRSAASSRCRRGRSW